MTVAQIAAASDDALLTRLSKCQTLIVERPSVRLDAEMDRITSALESRGVLCSPMRR